LVDGIAYVEIFTADSAVTVHYFIRSWGFTAIAEANLPDRYATLLPLGHNSPVQDWLDQHGGVAGVADIGMYCLDVPAMVARAVLEGGLPVWRRARPGADGHPTGTVGGVGTLRHTLVSVSDDPPAPPPDFPWLEVSRPVGRAYRWRPETIDHAGICLPTVDMLNGVAQLYQSVFGLEEISRDVVSDRRAAMETRCLRDQTGTITFVLAAPTPGSHGGQVDEFLAVHGDAGVHHLAFRAGAILGHGTDNPDAYFQRGVSFGTPNPRHAAHWPPPPRAIWDHRPSAALIPPAADSTLAGDKTGFAAICCDRLDLVPGDESETT
jgi:4-hydroxymandelate synthase